MANKQILITEYDGVELSVAVFANREVGPDGECVFSLSVHRGDIHFYCTPDELAGIGQMLIKASNVASVVAKTGVL